jgi:hypothetical protein
VVLPEHLEEIGVRDLFRIVDDAHDLVVAGEPRADCTAPAIASSRASFSMYPRAPARTADLTSSFSVERVNTITGLRGATLVRRRVASIPELSLRNRPVITAAGASRITRVSAPSASTASPMTDIPKAGSVTRMPACRNSQPSTSTT